MQLEAMLPDIHEVVLVDVPLFVVIADAGAGADAAIHKNRGYRYACRTAEHPVAHIAFVWPQETLATVGGVYLSLLACLADEVEQAPHLFACQLQFFVLSASSYRENRCQPPVGHTFINKVVTQLRQRVIVALMYTSHHVVSHNPVRHNHIDGLTCHTEAIGMSAKPGMLFFEAVEADGNGAETCLPELGEEFWCQVESVRHHSPREASLAEAFGALHNILSDKWLAAAQDDEDIARVSLLGDIVEHSEEVLLGHIGRRGDLPAVAAAMPAMDIAAHGTLPEHLTERMFSSQVLVLLPCQLKSQRSSYA